MDDLTVITNYLGFKQFVVDRSPHGSQDDHVCPNCGVEYTNEGDGVLCPVCVPPQD